TGIVAPNIRMADLGPEGRKLRQRLLAGLRTHPLELFDALPVCLDEVCDQLVHRGLRRRREVALDVNLADRVPERSLNEGHAALPPLADCRYTRDLGA